MEEIELGLSEDEYDLLKEIRNQRQESHYSENSPLAYCYWYNRRKSKVLSIEQTY